MLLPESELDQLVARGIAGRLDLTSSGAGPTEVDTHSGLHPGRQTRLLADIEVSLVHETVAHGAKQPLEVWPAVLGLGA